VLFGRQLEVAIISVRESIIGRVISSAIALALIVRMTTIITCATAALPLQSSLRFQQQQQTQYRQSRPRESASRSNGQ